jgi:hypothetical protein
MDRTLEHAVSAAESGDWHLAHRIVQERNDPLACWLHAILHKIEGDAWNSRYWYARTDHRYDDFADPREELAALRRALQGNGA